MDHRFGHSTYVIHRKFLQLFGATLNIFDPVGNLVLYARMAAFKFKEDIRLYTGKDMQDEVLVIRARQIFDFAAAYDVYDPTTADKVGALRRKGLKSLLKDEWILMDHQDREIGAVREDNTFLALIRRFFTNIIPQSYSVEVGDTQVAVFKQNFNPFVTKLAVNFSLGTEGMLDRRLGIAAAILLCTIEGKEQ